MTVSQRIVCVILSMSMLLGIAIYFPVFFMPTPEMKKEQRVLAYMLPFFQYCQGKEQEKPQQEDEKTYQEIVKANREYLTEQVIGENTVEEQEEPEEIEIITETPIPAQEVVEETTAQPVVEITREQLENDDYLLNHFFIVDGTTATSQEQLNTAALLDQDLRLTQDASVPQILIYHSHSQEGYLDSVEGDVSTSVVSVGDTLTSILQEQYGYGVIHVTDTFDVVGGQLDRNSAYDYARERVEQVLAENPSVEVVIDLHRDGVPEDRHLVTEVDGQPTAQIMFFNGLSYSAKNGTIEYLPNPNIGGNLAFSFQLQLISNQYYPDFNRPIYLSSLRYNLHLKPRALLLEVGAQNNTLQEAKNAMVPFAWILNRVLKGE